MGLKRDGLGFERRCRGTFCIGLLDAVFHVLRLLRGCQSAKYSHGSCEKEGSQRVWRGVSHWFLFMRQIYTVILGSTASAPDSSKLAHDSGSIRAGWAPLPDFALRALKQI